MLGNIKNYINDNKYYLVNENIYAKDLSLYDYIQLDYDESFLSYYANK